MNPAPNSVLLAIQPEHAMAIYSGKKRTELRKSFPQHVRLVFLYETAPVSAVTGAFIVREARRVPVSEAIRLAERGGVAQRRARRYYGTRSAGWVVEVDLALRLGKPIKLEALRQRNHLFQVPQTFAYLPAWEGLTQELMTGVVEHVSKHMRLERLRPSNVAAFKELVRQEVATAYEDIDDDFLLQTLDRSAGLEAAFSTDRKVILEIRLGRKRVGFTVLTRKCYGAWKSGPTMLLSQYRGMGIGQCARRNIEEFCAKRGALSIYCTCPESRPAVVSYLLRSGMRFQARLREHLSRHRHELVLAKRLQPRKPHAVVRPGTLRTSMDTEHRVVGSRDGSLTRVLGMITREMPSWYFQPPRRFPTALRRSIGSMEAGVRAYSAKGRLVYASFEKKTGRVLACVVLTWKRSGMLKLNVFEDASAVGTLGSLVRVALQDHLSVRRVYLTVPVGRTVAIHDLTLLGFVVEGVLDDPFGQGIDHLCLGLVHETINAEQTP